MRTYKVFLSIKGEQKFIGKIMRNLIVADIHSNLEALEAVLEHAEKVGYDRILCCGDIVGYNANPKEVIEILVGRGAVCIRGNHDRETVSGIAAGFNGAAQQAARWTHKLLEGTPYMNWLRDLPRGPMGIEHDVFLCHGSPRDEDEYMTNAYSTQLMREDQRLVFFGHTHIPSLYGFQGKSSPTFKQLGKHQWMINPGSVGQPRDGDSRTAYGIWDQAKNTFKFYRIPYDYKTTQTKIRAAGLPTWLADRLGD